MLGSLLIGMLLAQGQLAGPQLVGPPTPLRLPPPPTTEKATVQPQWPPEGVSRPGNGVSMPKLVREVKPTYRADAMRAKIQGRVALDAVVQIDGTIGDVRVTRSLDTKYGMDDEAVETVKKWKFTPGMKDGVAVPVVIEIEMVFTLKD